jgi:hypothetical protein
VNQTAPTTWVETADKSSEASVGLEIEYWTLKARGLMKRAEALEVKAASLKAGTSSEIDALEAQADAELARAEVKLCEANAQRLKDLLSPPNPPPTTTSASGARPQVAGFSLNVAAPSPLATTQDARGRGQYQPSDAAAGESFQYHPATVFHGTTSPDPPSASAANPGAGSDELRDLLFRLKADNDKLRERIEQLEAAEAR